MIALGYFFILLIGPHAVAMGAYADLESCMTQAHDMEAEGGTVSHCFAKEVPNMDDTVEILRDSRS